MLLNVGKPLRQDGQARPEEAALKDVRGKTHTHDARRNRISATSAATGVRRRGTVCSSYRSPCDFMATKSGWSVTRASAGPKQNPADRDCEQTVSRHSVPSAGGPFTTPLPLQQSLCGRSPDLGVGTDTTPPFRIQLFNVLAQAEGFNVASQEHLNDRQRGHGSYLHFGYSCKPLYTLYGWVNRRFYRTSHGCIAVGMGH